MTFFNILSKSPVKENKKIIIIVDDREKNSLVASELAILGFAIEFKHLPVADYLIKNVAIERKTISDFKSSIIDKRIISQLLELKQYPKSLLVLEGLENEDPYNLGSGMHENAFRGFLLSVLTEYQIPIIFTLNEKDTAKYISVLARKKEKEKEFSLRASKILPTEQEQLQFILEGFPDIGPKNAKKLLAHFKTLQKIIEADKEELENIIGKKSETVYKLSRYNYKI